MLGLRFCARAFSSCGKRGPLFIAVHGPLTIAASLVAEHRLQTCRLSSCGSRAQLFRSMWDLPRSGLEPMSPAFAGGFSTSAPPGKPLLTFFYPYGRVVSSTKFGLGNGGEFCPLHLLNVRSRSQAGHLTFVLKFSAYRVGMRMLCLS